MAVHSDKDEERRARVEAVLERLRATKKPVPKAALRVKKRNPRRARRRR